MNEQAGGATVGEFLEGAVDLRLELRERGRVSRDLLSPQGLLFRQRGLEILKGLLQSRNFGAGLAAPTKLHGHALSSSPLFATVAILSRRAAVGTTFWACTPGKQLLRNYE